MPKRESATPQANPEKTSGDVSGRFDHEIVDIHEVDLCALSKLLDHKNISPTEDFAKVDDDKKRQAVEMLPRLNGGAK